MHNVWEFGWTFHMEGPNCVVKYVPEKCRTRFSFAFNSVDTANEFWERVHPHVAHAEKTYVIDPYGLVLREIMMPYYREIRKREQK